uniref:Uncharacterized protein n=1 Tax=Leersia perrieri TaxID=77586 RepID=A0A0D9WXP9_9ORYZ
MKTKHNEEFLKMKTELDEARKVNAVFCQAAEPILDNLHAATAEINTSSFETLDLTPITSRYADGTTTEKALELLDEVDGMAQTMAKDALYPEEKNDDG